MTKRLRAEKGAGLEAGLRRGDGSRRGVAGRIVAGLGLSFGACAVGALTAGGALAETTLTVATVNNGDMIRMQGLMEDFNSQHPDIEVEWVTLEENVLRQRVTQDIATNGGQFDVMTIGTYEVPIWLEQDWLVPLTDMPEGYDQDGECPTFCV